jgi:hypothetical protein
VISAFAYRKRKCNADTAQRDDRSNIGIGRGGSGNQTAALLQAATAMATPAATTSLQQ